LQDDEYRSVIAVLGARGWAINRQDCGKQMAGDQELLAFSSGSCAFSCLPCWIQADCLNSRENIGKD
jgi:hypothetical protein